MKYFLLSLAALLLLLSCDSSTSPSEKSFTLSGKVSLLDTEGNPVTYGLEDIIVMIYNTVDIDPDLLQVKADYPHIGAEINQEVFFDIRDEEPIKTVSCDTEGKYNLSIPKGDYNICYYKEDYGYKLIHELEVTSDQALSEAVLHEVISLSGSISDFTFESGKVYHITDDLIIPANGNVSFETGTYVDVANNKKIFLMDELTISEKHNNNHVRFNSVYNLASEILIFRGLEFTGIQTLSIEDLLIKNSSSAILLQNNIGDVNISNCILTNNSNGISSNSNSFFNLNNSLVINNSGIGVSTNSLSNVSLSIFFTNEIGLKLSMNETEVANCYFLSNFMGIRTTGFEEKNIMNNGFSLNEYGISISGSSPNIEFNDFFEDNMNIELNYMFLSTGNNVYSSPSIHQNNFYKSNKTIISVKGSHIEGHAGVSSGFGINENLNVSNNFWENPSYQDLCVYETDLGSGRSLIFLPKKNSPVSNAGIINQ